MNSFTINEIESAISKASLNRNTVITNEMLTSCSSSTKEDDYAAFPYDYSASREKIRAYDAFVRKARHAIHTFSISYFVDEYNMTLDELEMYCVDMDKKRSKLHDFVSSRPFVRGVVNNHVEYSYINFDMDKVKKEYEAVSEECKKIKDVIKHIHENIKFSVPSFVLEEMQEEKSVSEKYYYDEEFGTLEEIYLPLDHGYFL